ncbi:MAG TPA: flagellar basal body P-ring protein FlgI [Vicinamibacterales bacterium]|nr:flagellar basal body P-ring protein FlgI [Vicinamibacterales bacterium]
MTNRRIGLALVLLLGAHTVDAQSASGVRLKDVARLQGIASMPAIGYGLVVGLNKTGDKRQTIFSAQTLANMLEQFGVNAPAGQIKVENVAAVLVTVELPPFARSGTRLDVTVASVGDARSLQGGILLPTALRGPDGQVRAMAQGPLSLGGFGGGSGGNNVQVNHLTAGRVPSGALVHLDSGTSLPKAATIELSLDSPDFSTAEHVAESINRELGNDFARATDAATISVRVPAQYQGAVAPLLARLEPLSVDIDAVARVVINERTGTVVVGGAVRLGPAAVAHGNLSVRIETRLSASQPEPFSRGVTTVLPQERVDVEEGRNQLMVLEQGTTLESVVQGLNALGASPRDIIAIMQALKAAGALRAELVIL